MSELFQACEGFGVDYLVEGQVKYRNICEGFKTIQYTDTGVRTAQVSELVELLYFSVTNGFSHALAERGIFERVVSQELRRLINNAFIEGNRVAFTGRTQNG